LPKGAQHNTIGELPFVEVMDDGDFYENDGDENLTVNNCNKKMMESCKGNAGCYLQKVKICENLQRQQTFSAIARGDFTASWLVFMEENCGSWTCNKDKNLMEETSQKFKKIKNKEWKDKIKWLGNQGKFEKGYMEYPRP